MSMTIWMRCGSVRSSAMITLGLICRKHQCSFGGSRARDSRASWEAALTAWSPSKTLARCLREQPSVAFAGQPGLDWRAGKLVCAEGNLWSTWLNNHLIRSFVRIWARFLGTKMQSWIVCSIALLLSIAVLPADCLGRGAVQLGEIPAAYHRLAHDSRFALRLWCRGLCRPYQIIWHNWSRWILKHLAKFGCQAKPIPMVRQFNGSMQVHVQNDWECSKPGTQRNA